MTTRAQLEALVENVRRATGPDQEIDAAAYRAIFDDGGWVGGNWYIARSDDGSMGSSRVIALPAYTASLDAVVALIEREFPGVAKGVSGPPWDVELHWFITPAWHVSELGETEPLALLAAFLAAKLSSLPEEA